MWFAGRGFFKRDVFVCVCRYWFAPVGISLGIKNSRTKVAPPNPVLEKAYQQCKKMKHKQVFNLNITLFCLKGYSFLYCLTICLFKQTNACVYFCYQNKSETVVNVCKLQIPFIHAFIHTTCLLLFFCRLLVNVN